MEEAERSEQKNDEKEIWLAKEIKKRKREMLTGTEKIDDLFKGGDKKDWLCVGKIKHDTTEDVIKDCLTNTPWTKFYCRTNIQSMRAKTDLSK